MKRRESIDASIWADGNLSDEREDDFACDRVEELGDDGVKEDEDDDEDDPDETFVTFNLPIVHRLHRTGFEEEKDFPVRIGDVVAGRTSSRSTSEAPRSPRLCRLWTSTPATSSASRS